MSRMLKKISNSSIMASNQQKIIDDLRNDAKTHQGKKITSQ